MEIQKTHWIGIASSVAIISISFFFMKTNFFPLVILAGILTGIFPFIFFIIRDANIAKEKEEMFLEFARNLVESVKAGTPVSKSIVNVKDKPYGVLTENIQKLANQISLGIPLSTALKTFSKDVENRTISRALTLIGQAERAGGDIGEILESVAEAVNISDKLKKERRATISTLVVQGYIIFFVFIIIILVMQFKIIPMLMGITGLQEDTALQGFTASVGEVQQKDVFGSFLYLLLAQGFFSGLTIGKLAEGSIKLGMKHSFILMFISFLVYSIASFFLGG